MISIKRRLSQTIREMASQNTLFVLLLVSLITLSSTEGEFLTFIKSKPQSESDYI